MFEQVHQQIEDLRFDVDDLPVSPHLVASKVELAVLETVQRRRNFTRRRQSPKLMPRSRAVMIVSQSTGTVRSLLIADTRGTKFTCGGSSATITPR